MGIQINNKMKAFVIAALIAVHASCRSLERAGSTPVAEYTLMGGTEHNHAVWAGGAQT